MERIAYEVVLEHRALEDSMRCHRTVFASNPVEAEELARSVFCPIPESDELSVISVKEELNLFLAHYVSHEVDLAKATIASKLISAHGLVEAADKARAYASELNAKYNVGDFDFDDLAEVPESMLEETLAAEAEGFSLETIK